MNKKLVFISLLFIHNNPIYHVEKGDYGTTFYFYEDDDIFLSDLYRSERDGKYVIKMEGNKRIRMYE